MMDQTRSLLEILLNAEQEIAAIPFQDPYRLYESLHQTSRRLASVDAFYVCLYVPRNTALHFVYNYDNGLYDEPATFPLGDGPTSYVLRNGKPFILRPDTAAVQRGGVGFGDGKRISLSALHVPMRAFDAEGQEHILGVLSAQSYQENAYDATFLQALSWLADRGAQRLFQRREQEEAARALQTAEAQLRERDRQMLIMTDAFVQILKGITRQAEALQTLLPSDKVRLRSAIEELCRACYRGQTEANQMPVHFSGEEIMVPSLPVALPRPDPLHVLSEREREIARLLARGLTNRGIGEQLHLAPDTVKFHVANILRKLGVANRAEVARIVGALPGSPGGE